MLSLPSIVGVPRLVCSVALVEWRGVVCVVSCVRVGCGTLRVVLPLCVASPFSMFAITALLV